MKKVITATLILVLASMLIGPGFPRLRGRHVPENGLVKIDE